MTVVIFVVLLTYVHGIVYRYNFIEFHVTSREGEFQNKQLGTKSQFVEGMDV